MSLYYIWYLQTNRQDIDKKVIFIECMKSFQLEFMPLLPVSNAQWQVSLAYVSGRVHAGKQTEVWVTNQRLYKQWHHDMASTIKLSQNTCCGTHIKPTLMGINSYGNTRHNSKINGVLLKYLFIKQP